MTDINETTLQDKARTLVDREVVYCVSSLVNTLAGGIEARGDIGDLAEQALELCSSVADYEEAAREAGWTETDDGWTHPDYDTEDDAESACHASRAEPYEREVYEHWIVSRWLADKLEAHGEKVDRDFAGMIVWARTTTGQAILLDGVIRDIVRSM